MKYHTGAFFAEIAWAPQKAISPTHLKNVDMKSWNKTILLQYRNTKPEK